MAYKKNKNYKRKSSKAKKNYSASEKASYKRGFFAGLFASKKKPKKKNIRSNNVRKESLLDKIKRYRKQNLGVLYHNGKYYDTNFIDEPTEIEKSFIKELHSEYDFDGKRSDIEVADSYVKHMRQKYGIFDKETGKFVKMMGE